MSTTRQKTSAEALRDRQAAGAEGSANNESKSSMQRPGDLSVENREPKKSTSPEAKTMVVDRHVRFPDLARKPTYRVSGEVPKMSIVGSFPAAPFASTGGGVSASAGKGIDPVSSSSLELDDRLHIKKPLYMPGTSWEPYFDFLEALWDEPWVEAIKFVTFNHRQRLSYYGHIPNLVNEDGEFIDATAPLVGPAGKVEQRYGSFANISVAGRWIAVVSVNPDLSRGPAMVHLYPGQILSRENCLPALADALSDGAQARGWITFEAGVTVVQEVMKLVAEVVHALTGDSGSKSEILYARHSMTTRSIYAKQDESDVRGDSRRVGRAAEYPQETACPMCPGIDDRRSETERLDGLQEGAD